MKTSCENKLLNYSKLRFSGKKLAYPLEYFRNPETCFQKYDEQETQVMVVGTFLG